MLAKARLARNEKNIQRLAKKKIFSWLTDGDWIYVYTANDPIYLWNLAQHESLMASLEKLRNSR